MRGRGEVRWHRPPDIKRRPALILGRDEAIERLHDLLVLPATSTIRPIETEVQLERSDGLPAPCALSLDNTFLAEKEMMSGPITSLGPARMSAVCRALEAASGFGRGLAPRVGCRTADHPRPSSGATPASRSRRRAIRA